LKWSPEPGDSPFHSSGPLYLGMVALALAWLQGAEGWIQGPAARAFRRLGPLARKLSWPPGQAGFPPWLEARLAVSRRGEGRASGPFLRQRIRLDSRLRDCRRCSKSVGRSIGLGMQSQPGHHRVDETSFLAQGAGRWRSPGWFFTSPVCRPPFQRVVVGTLLLHQDWRPPNHGNFCSNGGHQGTLGVRSAKAWPFGRPFCRDGAGQEFRFRRFQAGR